MPAQPDAGADMNAKSQRLARIEGEMQRVLSTLVSREVRDPRVGNDHADGHQRGARTCPARACSSCHSATSTRPLK